MVAPLLLFFAVGCVLPYAKSDGPQALATAPAAPPADFSQVDARLDALFVATDDVDRRDRLTAAMDFSRKSRLLPAQTQAVNLAFLQRLVNIEERTLPYAAPILLGPDATARDQAPEEEAVEAAPPVQEVTAPLPDRVAPAAPEPAAPLSEADRDAYVYKVREEAGARYVASRAIADTAARVAELKAVREVLLALNTRFPENKYAEAIRANLALVDRDLANLGAAP